MTTEQLLKAEQRAAEWMKKTKKMPPSSIEILPTPPAPDLERRISHNDCR
jgi:hypothetical protein